MTNVRYAGLIGSVVGACLIVAPPAARGAESDPEHDAGRIAHDHVLCRKYGGFEEGTADFASCLDALAKRRAEAAADANARRREAASKARALSAAENKACDARGEVINGGGRGPSNPHEVVGACGH